VQVGNQARWHLLGETHCARDWIRRFLVTGLRHEQVFLSNGRRLQSTHLAQHLPGAAEVILGLCTIGEAVEKHASEIWKDDIVRGLALEGVV
jgi:hypothetical protein